MFSPENISIVDLNYIFQIAPVNAFELEKNTGNAGVCTFEEVKPIRNFREWRKYFLEK
jgi:hypothetical protein